MSTLLARPYPVRLLLGARDAVARAASGDISGMQELYASAVAALGALDPDEVDELRDPWRRAGDSDKLAARAALAVADTWEGIVSVGSTIEDPTRFRGFAWLCAEARYGDRPAPERIARYLRGQPLPGTSPEDSALYVALPALVGLGPELAESLPGPNPLQGEDVRTTLGLPEGDWAGIDPLDGVAIHPEVCLAHLAGLPPAWRALVARCADQGLLIRPE